uniref:THAP-type domain-containing protein n=1 Tax=Rhipicephalus pulchellus TaxID=72859 RepID=L7LZA0_RHIPC
MLKSNRQRHCFVPGCKNDSRQKLSLFAVPSDEERFQVWQQALSGNGKRLEKKCVVCERHFESQYVCKTYRHTINGELVEIPRNRPLLMPDAVPTRFLTRSTPARRRSPAKPRSESPAKPRRPRGRPRKKTGVEKTVVPLRVLRPACPTHDTTKTNESTKETTAPAAKDSPSASRDYSVGGHAEDAFVCDPVDIEYDISSDSCDDAHRELVVVLSASPPTQSTTVGRTVAPHIVTARKASPSPPEGVGRVPSSAAAVPVTPVVPCVVSATTATSTAETPVSSSKGGSSANEPRVAAVTKSPLCSPPVPGVEAPAFLANFEKSSLPNRYWSIHYVQHSSRHVAFSFCTMFGGKPTLAKLVTCEEHGDGSITCRATVDGVDVKTTRVADAQEVQEFLANLDALAFCQGAASAEEFSFVSADECKVHGERIHSAKCDLLTPATSRLCDFCRNLRKVLQNKAAYVKRKASWKCASENAAPAHETAVKAEPKSQQPVASTTTAGRLEVAETVNQLPQPTELLVQTCIQASKKDRAQASGDKEEEWTLECTYYPVHTTCASTS